MNEKEIISLAKLINNTILNEIKEITSNGEHIIFDNYMFEIVDNRGRILELLETSLLVKSWRMDSVNQTRALYEAVRQSFGSPTTIRLLTNNDNGLFYVISYPLVSS